MTCERVADILDAYLDGEADALSARAVEEHLAECPACSRRLAARRALQNAVREKLPYFRAPQSLRAAITTAPASSPSRPQDLIAPRRSRLRYAIAAGLLLVGGIAIGLAIRPARPDSLNAVVAAVETDHVRSLQEEHLLDVVSTDQHTVKPWFAGKIPFSPPVPDPPGFPLRGGRLDWVEGEQAAALVYARNKHVINLLVWPVVSGLASLPESPARRTTASGHHVIFWRKGDLNFCAVSDLEVAQLADFSEAYRAAQ
jgi:anti-sigma factor (TIGR02949 family)